MSGELVCLCGDKTRNRTGLCDECIDAALVLDVDLDGLTVRIADLEEMSR